MVRQKLSVVVTRRLPAAVETRMSELFDTTLRLSDAPMTREELAAAMREADVRLKLIANYGAGVDHIDVATARQRGVLVSNTPGAVTEDTADMTLALILSVTRRIPEGLAKLKSGDWEGWSPTALMGGRIAGRRLGILGMGRIGQAVARRARVFGMQIHYHNRTPVHQGIADALEATYWESLDQMLACAAAEADETLGGDREHLARRGDRRERPDPHAACRGAGGRGARRV